MTRLFVFVAVVTASLGGAPTAHAETPNAHSVRLSEAITPAQTHRTAAGLAQATNDDAPGEPDDASKPKQERRRDATWWVPFLVFALVMLWIAAIVSRRLGDRAANSPRFTLYRGTPPE